MPATRGEVHTVDVEAEAALKGSSARGHNGTTRVNAKVIGGRVARKSTRNGELARDEAELAHIDITGHTPLATDTSGRGNGRRALIGRIRQATWEILAN